MKRLLVILAILLVLGLAAFLATLSLPRFVSYALSRATASSVKVARVALTREGAHLGLRIEDIVFQGGVEGTAKTLAVAMDIRKGLYFKHISLSGFSISVLRMEPTGRFFTLPLEFLDITDGVVRLSAQKTTLTIDRLRVRNINIGPTLSFEASIRNGEYIGSIDLTGEGIYNKASTDIRGDVRFTSVNLARIDKILKGMVDGAGVIAYKKNRFTFEGKVEGKGFELNDTFLRRPVAIDRVGADVAISVAGSSTELKIDNTYYKDTPFFLTIRLKDFQYSSLELSCGFLDVRDVTAYATSDHSLQLLWDALRGGQVRAKMLRDVRKGPITADLETKDIQATYRDMDFDQIRGQVFIDMAKVTLSNFDGAYKESRFSEVEGVIPFASEKPVEVRGKYTLDLRAIPPIIDLEGITFDGGTAEGSAEVELAEQGPFDVRGSGTLKGAMVIWKKATFSAEGSYTFADNVIDFDPLLLSKEGSHVTCKGKLSGAGLDVTVKGSLDVAHLAPFVTLPYNISGIVGLDGQVNLKDGLLRTEGDLAMDDLTFEVPGYMKKGGGVPSKARVNIAHKGGQLSIDRLSYELDVIRLDLTGTVQEGKKADVHVLLTCPDVRRTAGLFLLTEDPARGDVALDLTVTNLELPITKLPNLVGTVKINDGFLRLPFMPKPLRRMNLVGDFKGSSFDIRATSMVCGTSSLKKGTLRVDGIDSPRFALAIDMERLNFSDFLGETTKTFIIPTIPPETLLARASGDLSFNADAITINNILGKNLEITGVMADRKINVSDFRLGLLGGGADVKGIVDLAHDPYVFADFKLTRAQSDLILQSFGGTGKEIAGAFTILGSLKSNGASSSDLMGNMTGSLSVFSRNGVIRKWKFLSKLFGALNIYDLLRGKVSFTQDGLGYNKLGAAFTVNKGVFHTDNFLLDSPSMVLTGKGDLNVVKNELDGTVQVSPLIALDRTIDTIPIVRSILKKRGQGFLYLTYTVKGSLSDPDLSASVVSTIGTKTVEILRNILILPMEVFE